MGQSNMCLTIDHDGPDASNDNISDDEPWCWSRRVGMLCAAAGSICLSDYLFLLLAGVCVVRCVIVLCVGMVDVLVASVMIWYRYWERRTLLLNRV